MLVRKDLDEIKRVIGEELDQKIKFLITKDEFYHRMDELIREVRDLRERLASKKLFS